MRTIAWRQLQAAVISQVNPRVENICGAQWYPTTRTSPAGQPRGTLAGRAGACRVFSDHGFLSELPSFRVFRTYLQGIEKKIFLQVHIPMSQ